MGKRKDSESHVDRNDRKASRKKQKKKHTVKDEENQDATCFQRKRIRLIVSLLPAAMADLERAIHISLRGMLLKYSNSLGGVLLAYDDMIVEKETNVTDATCGLIINELPNIHFRVLATMLIFVPEPGKKLRGIVNESFPSHIGILVYSFFNAMISADHLHKIGFTFDSSTSEWTSGKEDKTLKIGHCIDFYVEKLHECNGIISLECVDLVN